jgi:putative FmdB family regulatory protein
MPIYEFKCHECGHMDSVFAHISEGPPKEFICTECQAEMYQNWAAGGGFILKGNDWAGKDIKRSSDIGHMHESAEEILREDKDKQKEVDEVVDVRRQGTSAVNDLKKRNPKKWERYSKASEEGYKPSKGQNVDSFNRGIIEQNKKALKKKEDNE